MMDLRWISAGGQERRGIQELPELLGRSDGFVWLDVADCDAEAVRVLTEHFHFHPLGVQECQARVPIAKIHVYSGHFFVVLHSAELGAQGQVRLFQMSQFIHEQRFLVTVHGPHQSEADIGFAQHETQAVLARMEAGRFRPRMPGELAHAIVTQLAVRLEDCVARIATEVERLERSVARGSLREYERMLESMFGVRHHLQAVRTVAATSREVHARMVTFSRGLQSESALWLQDLVDHFDRLKNVCDGERELLQEVLDLYQTRVANDLSQLVRKLTALGAILVADTLVAGIYGMNFDHMPELRWTYGYPFALGVMAVISVAMAWWFRRKDWL